MSEAETSKRNEIAADVDLTDPLCGRILNGRFHILEAIGSGGMGKVYKAVQAPLDRVVALKVLHPHFANSKDPGFVKRFVLEASMTSKLRHPNTVTVIDYGQTEDGIFYIAMEYLEGHTVADMLQKDGPIPWQRAVGIGQQVCRSLREAHKFGILHRDLKPANVMLLDEADSDVVKVLDFGLVKSFIADGSGGYIDAKITQTGMLLGSPQYMAPEQAKNQGDPRSDIYSFGVLLYEMITGRAPFIAKDYLEVIVKHLKDPPPAFRAIRPNVDSPPVVEAVVMRCLEKEPAHRFQTMDEVLDQLRSVGGVNVGVSSSFQAMSQTGKWATLQPVPPTPPPLPGMRQVVTPNPQVHGMTSTPAPYMHGLTPGGAHNRNPSGQFHNLVQSAYPTPTGELPQQLFADPATVDPAQTGNLFASSGSQKKSPMGWIIGGIAVLLIGGIGAWALTRESKPLEDPQKVAKRAEEAKKAEEAKAAAAAAAAAAANTPPAKGQVKFKVSSEPSGVQVFMGARDLGTTPTTFEVPAGPDGTATAELILIADGYHPMAVTAGGSGTVLIMQRLQKKSGAPVERTPVATTTSGGRTQRIVSRPVAADDEAPEIVAPPPMPEIEAAPNLLPELASTTKPAATAPAVASTPPPAIAATATASTPGTIRAADGSEVLPFGEGMSQPTLIDKGDPLTYSREALAAKVEGLMILKCVISSAGKVENCRTIKTLPYMEKEVLQHLYSRVYKPVTYQGKPVSVDYVLTVKLSPPRR